MWQLTTLQQHLTTTNEKRQIVTEETEIGIETATQAVEETTTAEMRDHERTETEDATIEIESVTEPRDQKTWTEIASAKESVIEETVTEIETTIEEILNHNRSNHSLTTAIRNVDQHQQPTEMGITDLIAEVVAMVVEAMVFREVATVVQEEEAGTEVAIADRMGHRITHNTRLKTLIGEEATTTIPQEKNMLFRALCIHKDNTSYETGTKSLSLERAQATISHENEAPTPTQNLLATTRARDLLGLLVRTYLYVDRCIPHQTPRKEPKYICDMKPPSTTICALRPIQCR